MIFEFIKNAAIGNKKMKSGYLKVKFVALSLKNWDLQHSLYEFITANEAREKQSQNQIRHWKGQVDIEAIMSHLFFISAFRKPSPVPILPRFPTR